MTAAEPLARSAIAVRTIPISDPGPLPARLPSGPVVSWVRDGDGIVGWGELARYEWHGDADAADAWWRDWSGALEVTDEVRLPGTGPVAFGSLAFDRGTSALIVPRVTLGRWRGRAWVTSYDRLAEVPPSHRVAGPRQIRYADGALSAAEWGDAVAAAVTMIHAGDLGKVVLARDLMATADTQIDPRFLLDWLAEHYAESWTYAVDGLVGATPELLVRRRGRRVDSRVLAGTIPAGSADDLLGSAKDLSEHDYAVTSTAEVLAAHCLSLRVPPAPSLIALPNVTHLATEITGVVDGPISSLALAAALNPTAAVCGAPTEVARDVIRRLEPMERGRYAGPVGWVDAAGDGDWGIALRCAKINGVEARLFAGCGIVADSVPHDEIAETQAKFVVMRDALESSAHEPPSFR